MANYRKLEVYKLACEFSDRVAVVANRVPKRLQGTADQLLRASDSIHEAVAEGARLGTDPQLLKYLRTALASANECEDELHALNRRRLLPDPDLRLLDDARVLCARIAKFVLKVEGDIARAERGKRAAKRRKAGQPRAVSRRRGPRATAGPSADAS